MERKAQETSSWEYTQKKLQPCLSFLLKEEENKKLAKQVAVDTEKSTLGLKTYPRCLAL